MNTGGAKTFDRCYGIALSHAGNSGGWIDVGICQEQKSDCRKSNIESCL